MPPPGSKFQWPSNKPKAHLPGEEVQVPNQRTPFDPKTMQMPNVVIINQNLTNGYSEDYDDDEDQEQRL